MHNLRHRVYRISDENGRMRVRLTELGIYKFRETRSPDGYVIDETLNVFELHDDGRFDGKLTLINHREDDSVVPVVAPPPIRTTDRC
jgi:uncharacterized surface anchored protein